MTKSLFCAHCQTDTEQTFAVSASGLELVATCGCGRSVKFPVNATADELRSAFAAHKAANFGQVVAVDVVAGGVHPVMAALEQV